MAEQGKHVVVQEMVVSFFGKNGNGKVEADGTFQFDGETQAFGKAMLNAYVPNDIFNALGVKVGERIRVTLERA